MEHLSGFLGLTRATAYRPLDHLQVEADLPLQHLHLACRGAARNLQRMLFEGVVNA